MAAGAISDRTDGVPLDTFLGALKAGLSEARRRIEDRREAMLTADLRATERPDGNGSVLLRLPPLDGPRGKDECLSVPNRCLMTAPFLQISELSVEFAVKVIVGKGGVPQALELLDRRRARRGDCGSLLIRLGGDDGLAGSVTLNDAILKEF